MSSLFLVKCFLLSAGTHKPRYLSLQRFILEFIYLILTSKIGWVFDLLPSETIEPVGSVAPNVNINDKVNVKFVRIGNDLSILCPAQAYPMPAHRWIFQLTNFPFQLLFVFSVYISNHFSYSALKKCFCKSIYPNIFSARINRNWNRFAFFTLEPVGSVPPKINSYSKFDEMSVHNGETLAILCPAQSFPVPSFR